MVKNKPLVGIVSIMIFIVLSGFHGAYFSHLLQTINVYVTLFMSFAFISAFFLFINLFYKFDHSLLKCNFIDILLVNLTSLGSWFSFFIAMKFLQPAIIGSISNAVAPVFTLLLSVYYFKSETISKAELYGLILICFSTISLATSTYMGFSGMGQLTKSTFWLGTTMAVFCGLANVLHTLVSKRLNNQGIEPIQIMSVRFFLVVVMSFFLVDNKTLITQIILHWHSIVLVAFITGGIGIFLLQVGIKHTQPLTKSYLMAGMPISYFILESFTSHIKFSLTSIFFITLTFISVIYTIWSKQITTNYRIIGIFK